MRAAVAVVILALVLPGCAGHGKAAQATPTLAPGEELLPPGVSNRLEGTVQTTDLLPLAGATIQLQGTNLTGKTNETGGYRIDNIPPKEYLVVASMDGYKSKTGRAAIEDDKIFDLGFVLESVPVVKGYLVTQDFRGLLSCQVEYQSAPDNQNRPSCAAVDPNNQQEKVFTIQPAAASMVVELEWSPNTAASSSLTMTVSSVGQDATTFATLTGPSVLHAEISESVVRKVFGLGGNLKVRVEAGPSVAGESSAPDVGVAVQQSFHVWATTFYNEAGPKGFSAVPPG